MSSMTLLPSIYDEWAAGGDGSNAPPPDPPPVAPPPQNPFSAAPLSPLAPIPPEPKPSLLMRASPYLLAALDKIQPARTPGAKQTLGTIGSILGQGFLGNQVSAQERMFRDYDARRAAALLAQTNRSKELDTSALTSGRDQAKFNMENPPLSPAVATTLNMPQGTRMSPSDAGRLLRQSQPDFSPLPAALVPYAPGSKAGDLKHQKQIDEYTADYNRKVNAPTPSGQGDIVVSPAAKKVVEQIRVGKFSPDIIKSLNYRGGLRDQVVVGLADNGIDAKTLQQNFTAEKAFWTGQNQPMFQKQRNNARMVLHSLDMVDQLNTQLGGLINRGEFPEITAASLAVITRKPGEAGRVARALQRQISDVVPEMGSVYMGGNAVTDDALALAKNNLASDWSQQVLVDAVTQARYNVGLRVSAMDQATPRTPGTADIDNAFDSLSGQGMQTAQDFNAALGRKRANGSTLQSDLEARGLTPAQIDRLRQRFTGGTGIPRKSVVPTR